MDFPLVGLMDEQVCYDSWITRLHPDGWACPRCHRDDDLKIYRHDRVPIIVYRCPTAVGSSMPSRARSSTRRTDPGMGLILRGLAQGVPTALAVNWTATARSC